MAKTSNKVFDSIRKKHGKEAITHLGSNKIFTQKHDPIPSGSLALDIALGIGGYPRGRIIEIYGPEGSGKTTLTLHAIAECQKMSLAAAFIDAEHAIDPLYARALGVDIDNLAFSQPDSAEQGLDIVEDLIVSGEYALIVVDSVAALTPQAELDGNMGDSHVALQARLMSQAMRKLKGICSQKNTSVIFINQIRLKVGVMFGNPETTPGGKALKFYSSMRLDIRRIGTEKVNNEAVANKTRVKVVKNKVAPPYRTAEFSIEYGLGIDSIGELIDIASDIEVIDKAGSWYSYGEERLGQGKANARDSLLENEKMYQEILGQVRSALLG